MSSKGGPGRTVLAMQTQGVDVGALLRRVAPMWLAWALLAVPALWMVVVYLSLTEAQFPTDVQVYDDAGNPISQEGTGNQVGAFGRIYLGLLLGLGNATLTFELPLLGLIGAVGVCVLWAGQRRQVGFRSAAALGAAISLALTAVGPWLILARESMRESLSMVLDGGTLTGLNGSFVAWGLVGLFGAILCWAFLRIGFGPVPLVAPIALPEQEAASKVAPEPLVEPEPSVESEPLVESLVETVEADPLAIYRRPSGS